MPPMPAPTPRPEWSCRNPSSRRSRSLPAETAASAPIHRLRSSAHRSRSLISFPVPLSSGPRFSAPAATAAPPADAPPAAPLQNLLVTQGDALRPAARFVTQEIPSTSMPICRATMVSGTVDIPTSVAPNVRNARISAASQSSAPAQLGTRLPQRKPLFPRRFLRQNPQRRE